MTHKKALIVAIGLIILLAPLKVLAASTTFSQKILPLDCVFEEVNDGAGTLYYVTPKACGVIVNPPNNTSNGSTAQPPAPAPSANTGVITPYSYYSIAPNYNVVSLGKLPAVVSGHSVTTIEAMVGQTYSYVIDIYGQENPSKAVRTEKHTLTIAAIDMSDPWHPSVTIVLRSSPIIATLTQGQVIHKDLDGDDNNELGIRADRVRADGVTLSLWQIKHKKTVERPHYNHQRRSDITWEALAVVLMVLTGIVARKRSSRRRNA